MVVNKEQCWLVPVRLSAQRLLGGVGLALQPIQVIFVKLFTAVLTLAVREATAASTTSLEQIRILSRAASIVLSLTSFRGA